MALPFSSLHSVQLGESLALQGDKGSAEDKLRLVLVWLLTSDALPSEPVMERVLASLASAGADTTSVAYLRRMRSMKLTGQPAAIPLYTHAAWESCIVHVHVCFINTSADT